MSYLLENCLFQLASTSTPLRWIWVLWGCVSRCFFPIKTESSPVLFPPLYPSASMTKVSYFSSTCSGALISFSFCGEEYEFFLHNHGSQTLLPFSFQFIISSTAVIYTHLLLRIIDKSNIVPLTQWCYLTRLVIDHTRVLPTCRSIKSKRFSIVWRHCW